MFSHSGWHLKWWKKQHWSMSAQTQSNWVDCICCSWQYSLASTLLAAMAKWYSSCLIILRSGVQQLLLAQKVMKKATLIHVGTNIEYLNLFHLLVVGNMVLSGGRTVSDAMPHHPKVKGSSPIIAFVTPIKKKMWRKKTTLIHVTSNNQKFV